MEAFEAILKRRSIRRYKSKDVDEGQIKKLLEAAMAAPSAHNSQPWEFVIVRDKEMRGKLSKVHSYSWMCAEASLVVVICGNKDDLSWIEDCSSAAENMLVAGTEMGLGGCWIAARGTKYSGKDDEQVIRDILGIPKTLGVLCMLSFGYPDEEKAPRTQYNEDKVHWEKYKG